MTDHASLLVRSNEIYDRAFGESSSPSARVLSNNIYRQYFRFREITQFIPDMDCSRKTIVDLGCGNGEFLRYLNFQGFRGHYIGIDINQNLLEEARRRFPGADFRLTDILVEDMEQCDVATISGLFNLDVGQDNGFVRGFLSRAAGLARERVIFNAISSYVNRRDPGFFYLAPQDAIDIAAALSPRFELRHGILPFNYTMSIHTDSAPWQSLDTPEA